MFQAEPTVTLVNRVHDEKGDLIPYEFVYSGEFGTIHEKMTCPEGVARIIVHNSMYRWGLSGQQDTCYKLGVPEWDLPCSPIKIDEFGMELIDRPEGTHRTTIKGSKLGYGKSLPEPKRTEPIATSDMRGRDGAFPGHYGERK